MKKLGVFAVAFALVFVFLASESQAQHYSRRTATGGYFRHYAPPVNGYYGYPGYHGYYGYPQYYPPYCGTPAYYPSYRPYYGYGTYGTRRGGLHFGVRF